MRLSFSDTSPQQPGFSTGLYCFKRYLLTMFDCVYPLMLVEQLLALSKKRNNSVSHFTA